MSNNLEWKKSSYCDIGATCVEVLRFHTSNDYEDDEWHMRDSKNPDGPVLVFNKKEWKAFILGVKAGEFEQQETPGTRPEVPDLSMTSDTELKFMGFQGEGYPARPSVPESHDG